MMYCERCNAGFPAGMIYCKWCGQILQECYPHTAPFMKCASCATPIQEGWTFCNSCGAKLTPSSQTGSRSVCLRCGAMVPPGASSCVRCGERFTMERTIPVTTPPANADLNAQHCMNCSELVEAGRAYCKACGAPVYRPTEGSESPYQTSVNPSFPATVLPPAEPPQAFHLLPTEPIQKTQAYEPPHTAEASPPQSPRTEVYQSLQPKDAPTAPTSTVAFQSPPAELPEAQNASSFAPNQTIEYSAFQTPPTESSKPTPNDLLAQTEVFDLFDAKAETPSPLLLEIEDEPTAAYQLELTAVDEEASPDAAEAPPQPSQTRHLEFDQLPFASTVPEPTELLNKGRATSRLLPPETADTTPEDVQNWKTPVSPATITPPLVEQPFSPAPPRTAQPPHPVSPQTFASPSAQAGTPWPSAPQANAWPDNPQVVVPTSVKKKSGSPLALIVVALLVLGAAGVAVWWLVLRTPKTIPSPNANASSNTPVANANSSTVNTNTATTNPPTVPEGMVAVAAGAYTLGTDAGQDLARPKHLTTLKAFFIDKTEVTNADYKKFIEATAHKAPEDWQNGNFKEGQAAFPVVNVTWQDANDYAKWAGKRLPTEAEWEAAARGLEGRKYPWGNQWDKNLANVDGSGLTEVGKFPRGQSAVGALDMIGNVWELTADEFSLYPGSPAPMPKEILPAIKYRVIRGGAFDLLDAINKHGIYIDATHRGYIEENKGYPKTGFRCAKDAN
ncbi:MAG: SUMF1/EgtB/PvdO family nonheme iron enzyme [Acidobacteria bacterium]|nr:SUMF1/EgtB/PvdO family nonheme iron enzyme [Acidobacteriota bacterium]